MSAWTDFIDARNAILHWQLNEASGPTADDRTTNNRDGTYNGTPTFSVDSGLASIGNGITLNSSNDFVQADVGTELDALTELTLNFVVDQDTSGTGQVLYQRQIDGTTRDLYVQQLADGRLQFQNRTTVGQVFWTTSGAVPLGGASKIVTVTYNAGVVSFYLDGLQYTASASGNDGGFLFTGVGDHYLGVYDGTNQGFEGSIFDFFLLNDALTQSEVTDLVSYADGDPPIPAVTLPVTSEAFIRSALVTLPVRSATIAGAGAVTLPVVSEAPDPAHYEASAALWTAHILLDGVDVSARARGQVVVEGEENTSGLASFQLHPTDGPVDLADYERKDVAISFEGRDAAGGFLYRKRRFTGITTRAEYDPDAGVITVAATNDLQGRFENMDRATIDGVVGGLWSEHVFDDQADGWQYALDRLSTQQAEMHVNEYGQVRVVPFAAGSPHRTFSDSARFRDTLKLDRVSRRELVSRVRVTMDFRFVRLRHREIGVSFVDSLGICGYLNGAGRLCSKSVIAAAADANPWTRTSAITYTDLPPAGTICSPPRTWLGDNDKKFCLSASWTAARRWAQTVTERYVIDVIAPDLEESIGPQLSTFQFGIDAVYDASEYERQTDFDGPPAGAVFAPETNDWQDDATDAERTGRQAMSDAQSCVLAWARALILGRARRNRLRFEPVYDPSIDLTRTIGVNTPHLVGQGKVAAMREVLDTGTGFPTMSLDLAISRHGGSGLAADDPLDPAPIPQQAAEENTGRQYYVIHHSGGVIGAAPDSDELDGWITNAYGAARTDPDNLYRERFRLRMPEIEQAARQALVVNQAVEYESAVPQDLLTLVQ